MAPKADVKAKAKKAPKREEEDESTKVEQPDSAAFAARTKEIQDKIDALQKKQAALVSQINEKSSGKEEFLVKRAELRAQIDEINGRMDELSAQKDDVAKVADGKRDEESAVRAQVKKMKSSMAFGSIEAIDDRIAEIEMKLQVDTMSLKEEKELMAEVKELKKCKPKVTQLQAMEGNLKKMGGTAAHKSDLNAIDAALYQCRAEKRAVIEKVNELHQDRNLKMGDITGVFEEKKKIGEEIGELIAQKKAIKQEEYDANREFQAYLAEQRAKRQERAAAERAERQAEYEQARRKKLADSLDEQPHLEEMTLIEQTISWCKSLTATKVEEVKEVKAEIKHDIPEGGAVLVSKKAREEEYFFEPTKKGKKGKNQKKAEQPSNKSLKHNAETFRCFDELKLDAPLTLADIPATIEKLEEKYEEFKAKVQTWKEKRDERKRTILEEGVDPDAVQETPAEEEKTE